MRANVGAVAIWSVMLRASVLAATLGVGTLCGTAADAQTPQGRIGGRIINRETGRPIAGARVSVVGREGDYGTDLDGRYRSALLPAGTYSILARMIGLEAAQIDSLVVKAGQTTNADFALSPAAVRLQDIGVVQAPTRTSKDAGLLATQQAAAMVSDGISAEAMRRAPDPTAADAIKRVSGISIYDGKFLVVRGLGERYSNALLNGAELPSPVLDKKLPPMDLFPAGLLESVVASKTATPDKPGDFAGGSVELTTKDFPEARIAQAGLSWSYNDQVTFKHVPLAPQGGLLHDWIAVTDDRRKAPPITPEAAASNDPFVRLAVLEGFHNNLWNPVPRLVALRPSFSLTYGDQQQRDQNAFGYVFSFNYTQRTNYTPDRRYNIDYLGREGTSNVEWGTLANLSWRLGGSTRFSWRNLYTRSGDERTLYAAGAPTDPQGGSGDFQQVYAVRYTERYLWQSQLSGQHRVRFPFVFPSDFGWKATIGRANINDPDNHSAKFVTNTEFGGTSVSAARLTRELTDNTRSAQGDWSIPFSLRHPEDGLLKFGGYYRTKNRTYDAQDVNMAPSNATGHELTSLLDAQPLSPEAVFSVENMPGFGWFGNEANDPYSATDRVSAVYGMLDIPLLPAVRLVSGVRYERWRLEILPGGDNPNGDRLSGKPPVVRSNNDPLWSANLTISLSPITNLRLAGARTLARPDAREAAPSSFTSINGLGECTERGDTALQRSRITNLDARFEIYPRSGEVIALSGFYKKFDQPIINIRTTGSVTSANALCTTANGRTADLRGAEFEFRKALDFLSHALRNVSLGANVTVVGSAIDIDSVLGVGSRKFISQSPVLVNGYLSLTNPKSGFDFSLLGNYFADRLTRYSNKQSNNTARVTPNPNWIEQGRFTLDAKLLRNFSPRVRMSFSGRNLTRSQIVIKEDSAPFREVSSFNPGISISAGLTYDF